MEIRKATLKAFRWNSSDFIVKLSHFLHIIMLFRTLSEDYFQSGPSFYVFEVECSFNNPILYFVSAIIGPLFLLTVLLVVKSVTETDIHVMCEWTDS